MEVSHLYFTFFGLVVTYLCFIVKFSFCIILILVFYGFLIIYCNIISWMINNIVPFDLFISLANNHGLCMNDSCQKWKFVIPLVASISVLIAILAISTGIWIFKQRKQGTWYHILRSKLLFLWILGNFNLKE